jgi:putative transposase
MKKTGRSDLPVFFIVAYTAVMRKEPFGVGSIVHAMKRGARGMPITKDFADQMRFARLLYFLNDEYKDDFWEDATSRLRQFERPKYWPVRKPLVKIIAWVLMPNHFHLIMEEVQEKGIARFMQKLSISMSQHFNLKYAEKGSIFQGPYKSRTIDSDEYFIYVMPYVMVKNVFELHPGGLKDAAKNFEQSWKWASKEYFFSSLPDYLGNALFPIIEPNHLKFFKSSAEFKSLARDMLQGHMTSEVARLSFEDEEIRKI